MKNIELYIDSKELMLIREKYQNDANVFYIEIDGIDMLYEDECAGVIKKVFECPYVNYPDKASYISDILFDLSWINKSLIVLVIKNCDMILLEEERFGDNIALEYLKTFILPWWNNDKEESDKTFKAYILK